MRGDMGEGKTNMIQRPNDDLGCVPITTSRAWSNEYARGGADDSAKNQQPRNSAKNQQPKNKS